MLVAMYAVLCESQACPEIAECLNVVSSHVQHQIAWLSKCDLALALSYNADSTLGLVCMRCIFTGICCAV